jgi:site-specific DNA-methyltransferase (adenine-specific)
VFGALFLKKMERQMKLNGLNRRATARLTKLANRASLAEKHSHSERIPITVEHTASALSGYVTDSVRLDSRNALACYKDWAQATCIVSDGPNGLHPLPGDPCDLDDLAHWYAPHIAAWHQYSAQNCTVWFWSNHLAWQKVHNAFDQLGWELQEICTLINDGRSGAANGTSSPSSDERASTEVLVRYTKRRMLLTIEGQLASEKQWLRSEWMRSGLPLSLANAACNVSDIATRKYLSQGDLWCRPAGSALAKLAQYCAQHAPCTDIPYFSIDRKNPITAELWDQQLPMQNPEHEVGSICQMPALLGRERVCDVYGKPVHIWQRPLAMMRRLIEFSTRPGEVVWEPFGGICSATVAAAAINRKACASESDPLLHDAAVRRVKVAPSLFTALLQGGEQCHPKELTPKKPKLKRKAPLDIKTLPLFPELTDTSVGTVAANHAGVAAEQFNAMRGIQ